MQGGRDYYSVEEAAEVLGTTPARVLQMLTVGELDGLPPGATAEGVWKVLLPVVPEQGPAPGEAPTAEESAEDLENTPEPPGQAVDDKEEPPEAAAVENLSRGADAATSREVSAPSGWVSTQQAARALNLSPRTVRWHIEQGNLEAKPEGEGVKRTWLVSIDSLQAFRDARQAAGEQPRDHRVLHGGADIAAESPGSAIRELVERLAEEAARAAEFRVRLELTEQAQSTLQAELEEERRRRVEAERARDRLRRALEGRQVTPSEPSESPGTVANEQQGRGAIPDAGGPQEPAQPRAWWRRMFGG